MNPFVIEICADTSQPALYRRTTHGGGPALILIAHAGDFFDLYETLANHITKRDEPRDPTA